MEQAGANLMTGERTVRIRPQTAPRGEAKADGEITRTIQVAEQALDDAERRRTSKRKPAPTAERAVPVSGYLQLVLVAVTSATTCLLYLRYFSGADFAISMIIAAAGAAVVTGVAKLLRWRALVTIAAYVLGFVLIAIFTVFHSTLRYGIPTLSTFSGLGNGLLFGWARMLSVSPPADPAGDLVLTPVLITWIAAAVSATTTLRTRALLAPVLPPLLAFGAGLVLTAGRPTGGMVPVVAMLIASLLLVLVRADMSDPVTQIANSRALWGRFALGVPVILVAVIAGIAGMHYLPIATGHNRFDLRDVVPVNLTIDDTISPLATLKSQLRAPVHDMFTARLGGDNKGIDRIRTAALDDYDGALWTSRDRFLLAGRKLPAGDALVNPRQVSMAVTIGGLPGPYLPEVGAPIQINGPRVGFSRNSATLATDAPALAGLHYDLVAEVGRRDGLDKAVPSGADTGRDTALPPGLPPEIQAKGAELAGAVAGPYAKLLAIQNYLQQLPYSIDARPGHSYDALRRLFSSNPADQAAYAEQFASAFTVLARSQGFPARVAVGYLLNPAHRKSDTYTITSADAHAWSEVNFAGYGWVAFEPTDPRRHSAIAARPPDTQPAGKTPNDQLNENAKASQVSVDPNLPKLAGSKLTALDWALFVLIGLSILIAVTPIAVATEKFRRRRARRSGSRVARITGAWQETTDRLVENGVPVTASSTAAEVAWQAQQQLGDSAGAVAVLAPLVTSALYSPVEPEEMTVAEAWSLDARLRRELRQKHGPLSTLRAWLDPRPLFIRWRDDRRRQRALDKLTRG